MNKLILTMSAALLFLLSEHVRSDDSIGWAGADAFLATKDSFAIVINDEVTGGCLPRPNALKDKMEIGLRKSGFKIAKKSNVFSNDVTINAFGIPLSGVDGCAVTLDVYIEFIINATVPFSNGKTTFLSYKYRVSHSLHTGPRSGMQAQLEKAIPGYTDDIYLKISRSKDKAREEYPYVLENKENIEAEK